MRSELMVFEFKRSHIQAMDFNPYMDKLEDLVSSPEKSFQYMHQVLFVVEGYDLDPRGLSTISEVKRFFVELHKRWPYFLFFCIPDVEAFSWWMGCHFFPVVSQEEGTATFMEVTPKLYKDAMKNFFVHANGLAEKFNYPMDSYFNRQKEMVDAINVWCIGKAI